MTRSTRANGAAPPSLAAARASLRAGTGAGVRVAILDSGVEASHPAFGGLALADDVVIADDGVRLVEIPGQGVDLFGHGTAIAAVIRRVAPDAEVGSFRVLNGALTSRTAIIREGARAALARGYTILNCSFGCRGQAQYLAPFKEWIDDAYVRGAHVVAACSNDDYTLCEWPGHFPTVLTVNMARAGPDALLRMVGTLVEFAAAGVDVELPWRDGGTKLVTGSSYAAPVVAGLLARLLSRHPALSPLEAKALLLRLAEPWAEDAAGPNVVRR